jgi:MOSC domain-containing protein YiiM
MRPGEETGGDRRETGIAPVRHATVAAINVSDDGLPKHPVERAMVAVGGVSGDRQRDLVHHGGRERAVCLYSSELIAALRGEGHPIEPGSAGENLTVRGVPWEVMTVGTRVYISGVELEVTGFADPCHTLRPFFTDETFTRISQKVHPGWSRVYARVVKPGTVAVGDGVSVVRG